MAKDNNTNTVTVDIQGLTADQIKNIVASYQKKQKTQYASGAAKREAVAALIKKYPADYAAFLAATKKAHGVTTK